MVALCLSVVRVPVIFRIKYLLIFANENGHAGPAPGNLVLA